LVAIDEGWLDNVIGKCGDQGLGFLSPYSLDPGAIVAHDTEAFAPGIGMDPDDRMGDRRIAIDFRLSGRKGPLTPSEIKHSAAPVEVPLHAFRQSIPRRGGAGELGIAQGQANRSGISSA
jgi:hypothetical protein